MKILWIAIMTFLLMLVTYTVSMAGCVPPMVTGPVDGDKIGAEYGHTLPSLKYGQVVLTFDDGPHYRNTPVIQAILKDNCVSAVFFLIGKNAYEHPQLVRMIANNGHAIGTHSYDHPQPFAKFSRGVGINEIQTGIAAVDAITNQTKPWFRYPGLSHNPDLERYTRDHGLTVWSIDTDTKDWQEPGTAVIISRILTQLEPHHRGIIILHENHASTVRALSAIINALRTNHYQIVGVL